MCIQTVLLWFMCGTSLACEMWQCHSTVGVGSFVGDGGMMSTLGSCTGGAVSGAAVLCATVSMEISTLGSVTGCGGDTFGTLGDTAVSGCVCCIFCGVGGSSGLLPGFGKRA